MSATEQAITMTTLRDHFPDDITDENDTRGRRFHCSCGFTGAAAKLDPALTRDEWLVHFAEMFEKESS